MALVVELPTPLEEELALEAQREGRSPESLAALLLGLATTLRKGAQKTPFQQAVKTFLSSHDVDPDRLASTLEELRGLCKETPPVSASLELRWAVEYPDPGLDDSAILQSWRNAGVHRLPGETQTPDGGPAARRPSARGKYSHLGVSSEDVMREHQEDIAREEKGWR